MKEYWRLYMILQMDNWNCKKNRVRNPRFQIEEFIDSKDKSIALQQYVLGLDLDKFFLLKSTPNRDPIYRLSGEFRVA